MNLIVGVLAIAAGTLAFFAVVALAVRSTTKRGTHGTSGTLSTAMLEVQSLLEPAKRHTIEVLHDESREEDGKTG